jgi:hypothetical protein
MIVRTVFLPPYTTELTLHFNYRTISLFLMGILKQSAISVSMAYIMTSEIEYNVISNPNTNSNFLK